MKASLEHASDAELERHAAWLLRQRLAVLLLLSRRQAEARRVQHGSKINDS